MGQGLEGIPSKNKLEELIGPDKFPSISESMHEKASRIAYACEVELDPETGQVTVERFSAADDFGNIINPMIVDGQIHGGLTMGLAPSLYEEITYDELGNNLNGTFMDYLLPTAVETPRWETGKTITPSPHHPIGAKGVGDIGGGIAAQAAHHC